MKDLFAHIKEIVREYVTHRLFVLSLVMVVLFSMLFYRLFVLQIVEGEEHLANFTYKIERTLPLEASRGNIYDRNGNLLAYNRLAYAVTFGNSSELSKRAKELNVSENTLKNQIVYETIQILENNGDSIVNNFYIAIDDFGEYTFTVSDSARLRFLAEVYSSTVDKLSDEEKNATAADVMEYLGGTKMFNVDAGYSQEDTLKIVALRYSLWLNRYQQYVPVEIALDVSDESVAQIKENSDTLLGMDIEVGSVREYNDSVYFAHIIGYIGNIDTDTLEEYNAQLSQDMQYSSNDMIGKVGLEKELEELLRGKKGSQKMYVDNLGRVLEITETNESTPGNDVYLTIDKDLQIYCYKALEEEIAGIILANMTAGTESKDADGNILIPINEIYFALFDNNVIDLEHMAGEDASANEAAMYASISGKKTGVISSLQSMLLTDTQPIENLSEENQSYMKTIYSLLTTEGIFNTSVIDSQDETYKAYRAGTISLGEYLQYGITQGAVDISSLNIDSDYYTSDEVYQVLVDYIGERLLNDSDFDKVVIEYMIKSNALSCTKIACILYDQGILDAETDEDYASLINGSLGYYEFMRRKISKLEITPAQLALDPCSGSVVVTDVNTGEILAMVSYPSYDNNLLTNSIDAEYYAKLTNDNTSPLYNRATQQRTAPGSTYKMLTTIAGVQENVIGVNSTIDTLGYFDKIAKPAKCWIYPSSHGTIGIEKALEVSCNYFYYEVGYRLGSVDGEFNDAAGLDRLAKYAAMFGLDSNSGVELPEATPKISDEDVVRSAIGQGTNSYTATQLSRYVTTIANSGNCYNLSLVKEARDFDGNVVYSNPHTVANTVSISQSLWNAVHNGMRRVVTDHTSATSLINRINVSVAGKTGTAQEDKNRPAHALFVSYAPFENPEISVTAVIPFGYSSGNAEELASFIYAYYFDPTILDSETVNGNNSVSD